MAGLSVCVCVCVSLAFSGAKFFARELYAALKGKGSWAAKVKLSNQAVRDVKLLAAFPRRWNGSCIWPAGMARRARRYICLWRIRRRLVLLRPVLWLAVCLPSMVCITCWS